ncbi:hypothetical protein [Bifidobacterium aemilianum]|uniref:hypothetical protein n=1 Tax=Bifidobacterium aemilianum TaxID=2493120 RepID=UPI00191BF170|nr:hypothetical protein [Bifidobacterium aemilianum]
MDGRITGPFGQACGPKVGEAFRSLGFDKGPDSTFYFQGWIYGTRTSSDYFAKGKPVIDSQAPAVPEGDFMTGTGAPCYYIAFDRHGKLGWDPRPPPTPAMRPGSSKS